MSQIVAVHGVDNEVSGPHTMLTRAVPAINDGLRYVGRSITADDISFAFYGDLFRPDLSFETRPGIFDYRVDFFREHIRSAFVLAWRDRDLMNLPKGFATAVVDVAWRQVGRYLENPEIREEVRRRVEASITDDTRILLAHSLGSVVAYEALCRNPDWPVHTFITFGSPLGIAGVVFDRLDPAPEAGLGMWPPSIRRWTNIADDHDRVALEPRLAKRFGPDVEDKFVYNRDRPHDPHPYMTSRRAGEAIAAGLDD